MEECIRYIKYKRPYTKIYINSVKIFSSYKEFIGASRYLSIQSTLENRNI